MNKSDSISYKYFENFSDLTSEISKKISESKLLHGFKENLNLVRIKNGSLLADPTNPKIKDIINEKIKKRLKF